MKRNELLLAVLAQLEREQTVSIPQLSLLLGCTEREVFEALETLVFAYDAASIRLDLHDTYATLDANRSVRLLRLTPREVDVLIDALKQAGLTSSDTLVKKILETKGMLGNVNAAPQQIQTVSDGTQASIATILAAACEDEEHHLIEIAYRGENDAQARRRVIEPAALFSKEGMRYVLAYCQKAYGWRTFRLDRIRDIAVLDDRFEPRQDIPSIADVFGKPAVKARVRFAANVTLPSWNNMRMVKTADDGARVVSITWTGSMWLPKHIVAMTGDAVALDPPELVDACIHFAESLLAADTQS